MLTGWFGTAFKAIFFLRLLHHGEFYNEHGSLSKKKMMKCLWLSFCVLVLYWQLNLGPYYAKQVPRCCWADCSQPLPVSLHFILIQSHPRWLWTYFVVEVSLKFVILLPQYPEELGSEACATRLGWSLADVRRKGFFQTFLLKELWSECH